VSINFFATNAAEKLNEFAASFSIITVSLYFCLYYIY